MDRYDVPLELRPSYNIGMVRATLSGGTDEGHNRHVSSALELHEPEPLTPSEAIKLVEAIKRLNPLEQTGEIKLLMQSAAIAGDNVTFEALSDHNDSLSLGKEYQFWRILESAFGMSNYLASAVNFCLRGQNYGHARILEYLQNKGFWSTDERVTPDVTASPGFDAPPEPKIYYAPIVLAIPHAGAPVISFLNAYTDQSDKDEAVAKGGQRIADLNQDAATLKTFVAKKPDDIAASPHFPAWQNYKQRKVPDMPIRLLKPQVFLHNVKKTQAGIDNDISRILGNIEIIRGR